ncbi:MAG: S-layer homology domain-containing protein [Syntrophomonadaceae bacterium]|nr:S-layer homology domain-containing protein [Syntrophomonadaceae bacterium]
MNIVNARRRRGYLAVVLALVMLAASFGIYVLQAQAAMLITWYEPASTLVSSDASGDYYKVDAAIEPDAVHFKWNFGNGMDRPIVAGSLQNVTLRNKDTNTQVPLDRGNPTGLDDNGVMIAGDFKFTKLGGGGGTGGELRLLELILQSTTLQTGTTYIIELGPNLEANNGSKLEKPYSWEFTTTGVPDTAPPTWPDKNLSVSKLSPLSLDLTWSSAADSTGVKQYKIYKDEVELATVDGNTLNYRVTGLTPDTTYSFKIEARDAYQQWSTDGPLASVTTPGADNIAPTWPDGSKLECTKPGEKSVTLEWTAAEDNYRVISYKIYKDGKDPITVDGGVTSCEISGLTGNTTYTFKVEAGDEAGNWTENGPSLTLTTILDATPPNWENASITVSNLFADRLTLEWTAATDNCGVAGYQVYQDENLIETVKDAATYNVTGLEPTTEYSFKVEAFDEAGNTSSNGPTTTVTTPRWDPTAGAGFNFALTSPASTNVSLDNTLVYNNVDGFVDGERCYFCWDFDNGLDETTYLQNIKLKKKDNGEIIPLSAADFTYTKENEPEKIRRLEFNLTSTQLAAGTSYVLELGADLSANNGTKLGRVYCWEFKTWPGVSGMASRLDRGYYHTSFIDSNKNLWVWGMNHYGQLGTGFVSNSNDRFTPIKVEGLTGITAVASGSTHNLALKEDGTVWAWGVNRWGQIGDGTQTNRYLPVKVAGLTGVAGIGCGQNHSVALMNDGSVWTWGKNGFGQLGDGTKTNRYSPVKVQGLSGVVGICCGQDHTIALCKDGSLWGWGAGDYGQLGDGANARRYAPVKVTGLNRVVHVSCGSNHSMAITDDGSVWGWGNNALGQLGDGTTTRYNVPVKANGLTEVVDMSCGANHSMALTLNGKLFTWGFNGVGQLGNGTTTNSYVPVNVDALTGVIDIECGGNTSLVIRDDGSVWGWGGNSCGELGNGNTTTQSAPVQALLDFTDTTAPEWPGGSELTAANPTINSVDLSWTPAAQDTFVYKLFKNDIPISLFNAGTTTYKVSGLEDDTQYTFKVEARDVSGNYSNSGPSASIATVAAPPTLLEAKTGASGSFIKLSFNKAMNDPAGKQGEFTVSVDGNDNPVKEVKLDYNTKVIKLVLTDSVPVGAAVTVSYTQGTVSSVQNVLLESFAGQEVVNEVATPINGNTDISDDGSNQNLAIDDNTPASVTVNVPEEVTGATISVESKLNEPQGDTVTTDPLPGMNISANTSIGPNPVQVNIPAGTIITAPAGWDGTLNLPTVKANDSVTVTPDAGKTAAVNRVIEIGCGDTALNFDKAVKIVIPGEAGKEIGFVRGGVFQKIDTVLTATTQDAVDAELLTKGKLDGKQDQGNDLVVWTKHFTSFVTYTQTVTNPGGGGTTPGGGGNGDGSGGNAGDRDFWVEQFTLVKNSSSSYTLRFDLSNGMDREVPGNLSKVHVYKKSDRTLIPYTSYNYIKQGTRDNPPKIRRLELTFNNLFKDGESYLVEISPDFTANNGNTFGRMYTTEFTIGATTVTTPAAGNNGSFGSAGGTLNGENATIVIPAGAFSSDIKISIEKVSNVSSLPSLSGGKILGSVVEIKADRSGEFNQAVTITLTFDKTLVDLEKNRVSIYWLDEKTGKWNELKNVKVDTSAGTVSGEINHFTKFTAMAVEKAKQEKEPEVVPVLAPVINLNDIKGHWAQAQIEKLVVAGAISGYPDSTFKPDQTISRAEFAAVLVKAFKLEAKNGKVFKDTANHWAKDAIATAAAYGIVSGYDADTFAPDKFITREQMAVMISKAANLTALEGGKNFSDKEQVSDWARDAVNKASGHKIISGYPDNSFRPKANASRAEAVTVIAKAS